jgi:hypothetical protein
MILSFPRAAERRLPKVEQVSNLFHVHLTALLATHPGRSSLPPLFWLGQTHMPSIRQVKNLSHFAHRPAVERGCPHPQTMPAVMPVKRQPAQSHRAGITA